MQTIVYNCPFVPVEWIRAHGMRPSRVLPSAPSDATFMGTGVCPYASAFAHAACSMGDADAIVVTTTCDQMRRISEWIDRETERPVFVINVPATWQTTTAHRLYASEVRRLGRFMVTLGGKAPTDDELVETMREYDTSRAALRDAGGELSPRQHSEAIARFHRDGTLDFPAAPSPHVGADVPLALVGGPLLHHHFGIFDLIESGDGRVALDGTTSGERTMPARFGRRGLQDDPFGVLVDAYFGTIPDAFRRPNSQLYQWLKEAISDRGIRGIILRYYTWCDTWHVEAQRMKEWNEVPVLAVACGADEHIDAHTASRIEAFLEMLR